MKIKALYVVPLMFLETTRSLGVKKKIISQTEAFRSHGIDMVIVDALQDSEPYPLWVQTEYSFLIKLVRYPFKKLYQVWHAARFKKLTLGLMLERIRNEGEVLVYLRHAILSPQILRFKLRLARLPNVRYVYLEVPTWPYDKEPYARFYERFLRPFMYYAANRVVTFSNLDSLFGIPAIRITNGIDVDKLSVSTDHDQANELKIVAAASLNAWVGIDRLLLGLKRYNDATAGTDGMRVSVQIAGHGKHRWRWQNLAKELGLQEMVSFHGRISGSELDGMFETADIAVGNLANHRRGLSANADLKNREYCARGIPFIISGRDDAFPEDFPYMHSISSTDEAVNFSELIDFHKRVRDRYPGFRTDLRNFAKDNLDWKVVLNPVVTHMHGVMAGSENVKD